MSYLNTIGAYWNSRSEGFSRQILEELEHGYDRWSSRLSGLLLGIPGKCVLDIGCGPGFFTVLLCALGFEVTAVDYSEDMLAQAESIVRQRGLTACFLKGDAGMLPFEAESFDAVVSRNLTWNLEEPDKAYREWLRILKPGGCIINCDGNHYNHYYMEEYRLERQQKDFSDGHNPEYMKNVDVAVIDEIARELPLSRELRPKWDIGFLLDAGAVHVEADVTRHCFQDDSGIDHSIIKNFILKAVKSNTP